MSYHDIRATFRPIGVWPGVPTKNRKPAPFKARWASTLELLKRELRALDARNVIVQVDIPESQIRLDGYPYANARAGSPGVILAFDSKYGPLRYPCDTFRDWEDNVRAIALAMEALRKVDRYGVTKRGEQYTGWKALPPGTAPTMDVQSAAEFLARHGEHEVGALLDSAADVADAYRLAAKALHPDMGGNAEAFSTLQVARRTLDAHHGQQRG